MPKRPIRHRRGRGIAVTTRTPTLSVWIGLTLCVCLAGTAGAQEPLFTNVTAKALPGPSLGTRSIAFGDYDNDGWPDLYLRPGREGAISLLHNSGDGTFFDHRARIQSAPPTRGGGSLFGDYDNDGDLDLFLPVDSHSTLRVLLRNDRGVFTDTASGSDPEGSAWSDNAVWLDYDGDGWLDLYVGNVGTSGTRNALQRNNGDGTFANTTSGAGLDTELHPEDGGSDGGMVSADLDGNGWPDLYVGVSGSGNRVFLNTGDGTFEDASSSEISDPGEAIATAVGDFDGDGDPEIFQVAGGDTEMEYRSLLLLYVGEGEFVDGTDASGISELRAQNASGVASLDVDNDGDVDLLIAWPHLLYLNNGDGTFVSRAGSGLGDGSQFISSHIAVGDYDVDGSADLLIGCDSGAFLYRNTGSDSHWLRVDAVGVESNRSAIGAQLTAVAGSLRQTREIMGGRGDELDELVTHFGLGTHASVDTLRIRWPSGQIDVLTGIPGDQEIRIFEGYGEYHVIRPSEWLTSTDSVVVGLPAELVAVVKPSRYESNAPVTGVTADVSTLGGPAQLGLLEQGDGQYALRDVVPEVKGPNRVDEISILIEQSTELGIHWVRMSKPVTVVPGGDLSLYDEVLADGWSSTTQRVVASDPAQTQVVQAGTAAWALQVEEDPAGWQLQLSPPDTVSLVGYDTLSLYFHPLDVAPPSRSWLRVQTRPGRRASLLYDGLVDLERKEWQRVVIPVTEPVFGEELAGLWLSGYFGGTFYLDDIRLIAARPGRKAGTAVTEERSASLPSAFSLAQNYPNPFNSITVIRFSLPEPGAAEVALYNLAGQRVATLTNCHREAGTYTLRWDGRDDAGRELASGVYLYRLQAGGRAATRKLLLIR